MSDTPTTTVDLSARDDVGVTGHVILVKLPTGETIDLWVYANDTTCSVDVRGDIVRTIEMPGCDLPTKAAAVVLR